MSLNNETKINSMSYLLLNDLAVKISDSFKFKKLNQLDFQNLAYNEYSLFMNQNINCAFSIKKTLQLKSMIRSEDVIVKNEKM